MSLLKNSKSRFGEIFGRTWDTFFSNFWKFFWVALVLLLVETILLEILKVIFAGSTTLLLIGGIVNALVYLFLTAVLCGAVYYVSAGVHEGSSVSFADVIKTAFARILKYTLMILRLMWYVLWPVALVIIVSGACIYLLGSTANAMAQTTETALPALDTELPAIGAELPTLGAFGGLEQAIPGNPLGILSSLKPILTANIPVMVIGIIGLLAIVFLVTWRTVKATFAFAALTDKNCGVNEALETSIETVCGNWWKVFGNLFFFSVLSFALYFLLFVVATFAAMGILGLLALVKLDIVASYVGILVPLAVFAVASGMGALFHYVLYKKI